MICLELSDTTVPVLTATAASSSAENVIGSTSVLSIDIPGMTCFFFGYKTDQLLRDSFMLHCTHL